MRRYSDSFVTEVIARVAIVGAYRASVEYGVAYQTARRWHDHAHTTNPTTGTPKNTATCRSCRAPLTRRTPPKTDTPATLCQSCATTARADAARGHSVQELARRYTEEGQSTNELAALTGHSQAGIYDLLKRHGVPMRSRRQGTAIRKGGTPTHGKIAPEAIIILRKSGLSITRIAADLSISVSTVKHHLNRDQDTPPTRPRRPLPPAAKPVEPGADQPASRFSQNLRLLQGVHNLSGARTARLLGVSFQSFSDWTTGKQEPGMKSLKQVSALFGVPLGLLIDADRIDLAKMYFAKGHYAATENRIAAAESRNEIVRPAAVQGLVRRV